MGKTGNLKPSRCRTLHLIRDHLIRSRQPGIIPRQMVIAQKQGIPE
jgi:hypothetical protein